MIHRDPQQAENQRYDMLIVGGGVQGICIALEAARRGLRPLLLERADFGGATSHNTLRILHGGLRYLQQFDLRRCRASIAERRWFCQHFPDLVRPLPCLMPLYGRGLKRPMVMRAALALNDALARQRNEGVDRDTQLERGRVLNAQQTVQWFNGVDRKGLQGAGLWYDTVMLNPQRLLIEMLHWANALGAVTLNFMEAKNLRVENNRVIGVTACDRISDRTCEYAAPLVVNAAGPWCAEVASRFGCAGERCFPRAMAFNVLLDRPPLSEAALAVQPRRKGAPVYFLNPMRGCTLAGTVHVPCPRDAADPQPTSQQVEELLNDLNEAISGLELRTTDVARIDAGLLPAEHADSPQPSSRDVVFEHAKAGGPQGLLSVSGVKFTTARRLAERTLRTTIGQQSSLPPYHPRAHRPPRASVTSLDLGDAREFLALSDNRASEALHALADDEAVMHPEDLVHRRTDWTTASTFMAQRVEARVYDLMEQHGAANQRKISGASSDTRLQLQRFKQRNVG